MIRVRVLQDCYHDNRIRKVGEEFEAEDGQVVLDGAVLAAADGALAEKAAAPPSRKGRVKPPPGTTAAFLGQDAIDPHADPRA